MRPLVEAVQAEPDRWSRWLVLSDALLERSDWRGRVIALAHGGRQGLLERLVPRSTPWIVGLGAPPAPVWLRRALQIRPEPWRFAGTDSAVLERRWQAREGAATTDELVDLACEGLQAPAWRRWSAVQPVDDEQLAGLCLVARGRIGQPDVASVGRRLRAPVHAERLATLGSTQDRARRVLLRLWWFASEHHEAGVLRQLSPTVARWWVEAVARATAEHHRAECVAQADHLGAPDDVLEELRRAWRTSLDA